MVAAPWPPLRGQAATPRERRRCLHGSIETQYLLPTGTPEEVAATVRKMCGILGRDGGFILAPCHTLQVDGPTPNVRALYATGLAGGRY